MKKINAIITGNKYKPTYSEDHGMWIADEKVPGETGDWRSMFSTKFDTTRSITFEEMSEDLRAVADHLEELAKAGVTIEDAQGDGCYTFQTSDPTVAAKFRFEWEPFEWDENGKRERSASCGSCRFLVHW
jgi:hypothetical protein